VFPFFQRTFITIFLILTYGTAAWAGDVTLNFKNADIRAFIDFAAKFSGKNFLVDNRVKGNISLVSQSPMSEEDAYRVFLSVLEIHGFAAVDAGPVTKIVPRAESKQKSIPVHQGTAQRNDAMVTQVLRLKYADSQQLVALIRPLISPNSHLVAYPRGNMLLLTDSSSNIRRIQQILRLLDRKDAVGVQLFTLKHASADKLAATLSKLYPSAPNSPNGLKVMAQQPGNMLIVVGAPQRINEVGNVIARLDVAPEADSGRLQVRYLKHGSATDIAKVITSLIGSNKGAKSGSKPLFSGEVKVVADKVTNALLITADHADMKSLNHIIDKLDIRRRQVLIEALIVEVSGNDIQRFGMEWMSTKGVAAGVQNFNNIQPIGAALSANQVAAAPVSLGATLTAAAPKGLVLGVVNKALSIAALVHAMESDNDANILSTPNLLTMDNEEAEIIVGQNVPFITGTSSSTGTANPNPFQTIERKDIGLTLRVKPQISEGNSVRLQIYQEISGIDTQAGMIGNSLITTKRSIKTVVLANDDQMIVLGGLMREDAKDTMQRVPCLGNVPLLGEAFRYTEHTKNKTNLMVFLKPHIITSSNQVEALTNQKYNNIKELYEQPSSGGTLLFPQKSRHLPKNSETQQQDAP